MKTFAVCNHLIKKKLNDSEIDFFNFNGTDIPVGLLSIDYQDLKIKYSKDVLVKIQAFSCNFRDRTLFLQYNYRCDQLLKEGITAFSPFGSEFFGIVMETGKEVKNLKKGDRVIPDCHYNELKNEFMEGVATNFASQRMQIFNENKLIKISDSMPDEVAASFSIAAQTSYSMVRKASLKEGMTVLITAATSNTSLAIINSLKNKNVKIFATSTNSENEAILLKNGVDVFVPSQSINNKEMYDLTRGRLFDVIFDPYFDLYINELINYINYNGKYIYCGFFNQYGNINQRSVVFDEDYRKMLTTCISKNISIIGNCIGHRSDLEQAIKNYSENKFDILVDSVWSDSDMIPFLEKSFGKRPRLGKVVYKYTD